MGFLGGFFCVGFSLPTLSAGLHPGGGRHGEAGGGGEGRPADRRQRHAGDDVVRPSGGGRGRRRSVAPALQEVYGESAGHAALIIPSRTFLFMLTFMLFDAL